MSMLMEVILIIIVQPIPDFFGADADTDSRVKKTDNTISMKV